MVCLFTVLDWEELACDFANGTECSYKQESSIYKGYYDFTKDEVAPGRQNIHVYICNSLIYQ